MKVKSLLAAGILAPALTAAIVLIPAARANASTVANCTTGHASGSTVTGDHCGGYPPDGTYYNSYIAITGYDLWLCATVKMEAQGVVALGTGCTEAG
jgi:hypothetical protein